MTSSLSVLYSAYFEDFEGLSYHDHDYLLLKKKHNMKWTIVVWTLITWSTKVLTTWQNSVTDK